MLGFKPGITFFTQFTQMKSNVEHKEREFLHPLQVQRNKWIEITLDSFKSHWRQCSAKNSNIDHEASYCFFFMLPYWMITWKNQSYDTSINFCYQHHYQMGSTLARDLWNIIILSFSTLQWFKKYYYIQAHHRYKSSCRSGLTLRHQSKIVLYECAVNGLEMVIMGCCQDLQCACAGRQRQLRTDGFREMKQF